MCCFIFGQHGMDKPPPQGIVEYKQLYNTFKSRAFKSADGFSIYSVAFDEDRTKWLNQIKKDGVTWTNLVIEMATYDSQYFDLYDFRSMPYTFLLGPNRKVIAVNPSYGELYNRLNKSLKSPIPPPKAKDNTNNNGSGNSSNSGSGNANTGSGNSSNSGGSSSSGNSGSNSGGSGTSTTPTPPTSGKVYKVQLGVFRNPKLSKFSKLNDLGTLGTEKISSTSSLSRVLLGNFSKSASKKTLKTVKSRGFSSAFLVTRDLGSGGNHGGGSSSGNSSSGSSSNTGGASSTTSTTVYKVQLGVFRNPNLNAFKSLKSIGKIEVESTSNGLKRVLLGTFARADKDAALKQVQAKGFRGFLVKRTGTVTGGNSSGGGNTTTPTPPISSGRYKIQLGVFGNPQLSKFSNLNDLGTLGTERATSRLKRVLLGSFSASKAKTVLAKVKARGYKDAFVVKR